MKVRIECSNCHVDLPLTKIWQDEMERPEMMVRDIEIVSHGICQACLKTLYGDILGEEGINYVINDNEA